MSKFKSDFLSVLDERGFIHQISDPEPASTLCSRRDGVTAYIGFDRRPSSLHVGELIPIDDALLAAADRASPVALMGGGTGMVGDPSFRTSAQADDARDDPANIDGIKQDFRAAS